MGEVNIDNDNAVEIVDLKIQLEAIEDKIIVMVDSYKSGYECETCGGTGKIKSTVVEGAMKDCEKCKGKGALIVVPEISKSLPTLGTVMSLGEKTAWRQYLSEKSQYTQEATENNTAYFKDREQAIKIRPGAKVLFSPHVGTFIPLKGNISLKIMREHEPLCVLYGAGVQSKDFVDFDIPFEQRY